MSSQRRSVKRRHFCSKCETMFDSMEELDAHFDKLHARHRRSSKQHNEERGQENEGRGEVPSNEKMEAEPAKKRPPRKKGRRPRDYANGEGLPKGCSYFPENPYPLDDTESAPKVWKPFSCNHCAFNSKYLSSMRTHLSKAHFPWAFPCSECGLDFPNGVALRKHERSNHPAALSERLKDCESFPCEQCGALFETFKALNLHLRVHKNNADRPPPFCKVCELKFSNRCNLSKHLNTYHSAEHARRVKQKGFLCTWCGRQCATPYTLMLHEQRHHADPIHACPVEGCTAKFNTSRALHSHQIVHDSATHQCSSCGATFRHRSSLRTHMRAKHSPKADFFCRFCSKGFRYREAQKRHQLKHTRPHHLTCEDCSFATYDRTILRRHRLVKHPKARPNEAQAVASTGVVTERPESPLASLEFLTSLKLPMMELSSNAGTFSIFTAQQTRPLPSIRSSVPTV